MNNAMEDHGQRKDQTSRELKLRQNIEDYYLPKQLVNAIFEAGGIP